MTTLFSADPALHAAVRLCRLWPRNTLLLVFILVYTGSRREGAGLTRLIVGRWG